MLLRKSYKILVFKSVSSGDSSAPIEPMQLLDFKTKNIPGATF